MWRRFSLVLLVALCLPGHAAASCTEQQVKLRYNEHTVSTVKSYLCTVGRDRLRIEFYELSGVASGMVMGQSPMTAGIAGMFGRYKLGENIVGLVYNSLFDKFASSFAVGDTDLQLFTQLPAAPGDYASLHENKLRGGKIKAILENPSEEFSYPISTQLASIANGKLPPGTHFYYWGFCNKTDSGELDCRKPNQVQMFIWRGMTAADFTDYKQNLSMEKDLVLNQGVATSSTSMRTPEELQRYEEYVDSTLSGTRKSGTENYLEFVNAVAGEAWPEDFLILKLAYFEEGCAEDDHWNLGFAPRDMRLRVARITNQSDEPMTIDGPLGTVTQSADLRPVQSDWSPPSGGGTIEAPAVDLAPGESLIIPIQIRFPAPGSSWPEDVETSDELVRLFGAGSLRTKPSDYAFPPASKDYAYGPEIELSGVRANGTNVELVSRSANFVEMVASYEEGSCPFLIAWDGDDEEWVDHGKVLHEAKGASKQQTETVAFTGLRTRFRLEEREPEIAVIDAVTLELKMRDGLTRTLRATHQALAHDDDFYLRLFRDEAVELVFELPGDVHEDDVVESQLSVTGYYQLYAQIRAARAAVTGETPFPSKAWCPLPQR